MQQVLENERKMQGYRASSAELPGVVAYAFDNTNK